MWVSFMKFVIAAVGPSSQYTYEGFMEEYGEIVSLFSPERIVTNYIGEENSIAITLKSLNDLVWLQRQFRKEISLSEYAELENGDKIPILIISNLPDWDEEI